MLAKKAPGKFKIHQVKDEEKTGRVLVRLLNKGETCPKSGEEKMSSVWDSKEQGKMPVGDDFDEFYAALSTAVAA